MFLTELRVQFVHRVKIDYSRMTAARKPLPDGI